MSFCAVYLGVYQFREHLGHASARTLGALAIAAIFLFALSALSFALGWCGEMTLPEFLLMTKVNWATCTLELSSAYGMAAAVIFLTLSNCVALMYSAVVRSGDE
jgi:hypothetical protein